MSEHRFAHRHRPVYRVVRADWEDPLDASFSRRRPDRRWNTADFGALYCCCSEAVARAVAQASFEWRACYPKTFSPTPGRSSSRSDGAAGSST